jgi:peptide/nickel transport system permease protein
MIADGREFLPTARWTSLLPVKATLLTILAVDLLGDWLRDHLGPSCDNSGPITRTAPPGAA